MNALRNGLTIGFLLIACIVGLQVSYLLVEAGKALERMESSAAMVLSSASATLDLARSTLATQQGYYRDSASHVKALTRAAAIDAIELGRLIGLSRRAVENIEQSRRAADEHLASISSSVEGTLTSAHDAIDIFAKQTQTVGEESAALLQAATETTKSAGELAGGPALKQSLANLEASTDNLQRTTAAAAEATGYIRDMLSPTKKSFWRRLLELLIPRPAIQVP